ncbi:MAG: DUF4157 domain-containing protein [Nitrospirota bacterium]
MVQTKPLTRQITPVIQKQIEKEEQEGEKEEEEEILQARKVPEVATDLEFQIKSLRGGGQPLPKSTRAFFERRFGYNFSHVRVHNDKRAVELAKSVNAKAFTLDRDIVFGKEQYKPDSTVGKQLFAHELMHVLQQKALTPNNNYAGGIIFRSHSADDPYRDIVTFDRIDRRRRIDSRDTIHYAIEVHIPREINGVPVNLTTVIDCLQAALRVDVRRRRVSAIVGDDETLRTSVQESLHRQSTQDVINITIRYTRQPQRGYRVSALQVEESPPVPIPEPEPEPEPGGRTDIEPPEDDITREGRRRSSRRPPGAQIEEVEREREMLIRGPICGPNVTSQIRSALSNVRYAFGRLTATRRSACRNLDHLPMAAYSWDIIDLHNSDWIWQIYRPFCATHGYNPSCGHSVQVGSQCHYAGSANYVVFGLMCKLCYELGLQRFTEEYMLNLIRRYKSGAPNYIPSRLWAIAGYHEWPSAETPQGDRSNCLPTCDLERTVPMLVRWCPMLDPDSQCP